MKTLMIFNMHNERDKEEYEYASKGKDMYLALTELSEKFRQHRKYDTPLPTEEDFYEALNKYNVII